MAKNRAFLARRRSCIRDGERRGWRYSRRVLRNADHAVSPAGFVHRVHVEPVCGHQRSVAVLFPAAARLAQNSHGELLLAAGADSVPDPGGMDCDLGRAVEAVHFDRCSSDDGDRSACVSFSSAIAGEAPPGNRDALTDGARVSQRPFATRGLSAGGSARRRNPKCGYTGLTIAMSESAAIVKLFFPSIIAQNRPCGYTTSDRSGG